MNELLKGLWLAGVIFPLTGFAWSSPGHMIIAAIAYRDLPAQSQLHVTQVLQQHPEYMKWVKSYRTNASVDLQTFVFLRASTWPDEIRRKGNPYDHPQWHYVNFPLIAPEFPDRPNPFPTNDILYGIGQCEQVLKDKKSPAELRAVSLSWLLHLVGDIHQPLHCVSLVNSNYPAPEGDRGGNGFFVKPNAAGVNLHGIWDKSLGSSGDARSQYTTAIEITAARPRKSLAELSRYKTAKSWASESRVLAIEYAYLNGKLVGSTQAMDAPALPSGYTRNLKLVAEKQAAIAGYRLADEIKKYFP